MTMLARGKVIKVNKAHQGAILQNMWSSAAGEVLPILVGSASQTFDGITVVSAGRVPTFREERDRLKQDLEDIMDIMSMMVA
jgi:hypothetical protein